MAKKRKDKKSSRQIGKKLNHSKPAAVGKIHNENTIFMHMKAGEGSADGNTYDLLNTLGGNPIIKSHKTGQAWSISWEELLRMAIKMGVDEEQEWPNDES